MVTAAFFHGFLLSVDDFNNLQVLVRKEERGRKNCKMPSFQHSGQTKQH